MEMILRHQTQVVEVADESQVGDARRRVGVLARDLGFDPIRSTNAEIVASEMATNLWLHGRGGMLLVRIRGVDEGIELLAIDQGPGMENVDTCLRDGYSTAGTAGNGLGAIRRLSQEFDIYSRPGAGAVVFACCLRGTATRSRFQTGCVCVPIRGESECGDAWSADGDQRLRIAIADGLGHGPEAAIAAKGAIAAIGRSVREDLTTVLQVTHRAIAGTRGAAVAVCEIDPDQRVARYAGIGNIAGVILQGGASRSMVSHNGIVGHQLMRVHEFSYPWSTDAVLVMHSDGLQSRWSLDAYPGLVLRHPAVIAAVLFRDCSRGRDDLTVLAMREAR